MFTVDNKFELNQQVFVVKKEHKTVEKQETCDVCLGEGRITYKGYKMTCPKCNGKKEVVLDSQKMDVYSVDDQPHTITSYRYSVTRQGNFLKYRIDGNTLYALDNVQKVGKRIMLIIAKHCNKYKLRTRVRHINRKKEKLEKIRRVQDL